MDFARKILSNYGWKEGEGLGKNKDGIAKPLRATLKFDNAGFGADQAAADFNNHWWERVFNEAATNVNVKYEGEQVKMVVNDNEDGVEISTKGYSVNKLKKLKRNREESCEMKTNYENFLQASTLTNLGNEIENTDKIDANDIEVSKVKVLTDEELFKACGGRTAHKGARHGLKLSGKLSRIEKQEAVLLAKMMEKRNDLNEDKKSKQKDHKTQKHLEEIKKSKKNGDITEECEVPEKNVEKLNKKKKKRKNSEKYAPESVEDIEENSVHKSKRKKKKTAEDEHLLLETVANQHIVKHVETMSKKKKNKNIEEDNIEEIVQKKKKRKNKHKDI